MAPKASAPSRHRLRRWLGYGLIGLALALLVDGSLILFYYGEQFLITYRAFLLPAPEHWDPGSPAIAVSGLRRVPKRDVLAVFGEDFNRSVYLLPLEERRRDIESLPWVRTASVWRIWPNRLAVRVKERDPVAFVQLSDAHGDPSSEALLIDADGEVLDPQGPIDRKLHIISGISNKHTRPERVARIQLTLAFLADVGDIAERITEINVASLDNVRAGLLIESRVVTLLLGSTEFRKRILQFLENYPEIRERLPGARVFDLRLRDRIIQINEEVDHVP